MKRPEEKLCEPGSYVTANIQDQSIVTTRDTDGTLRAFYNDCKHRGHELVQGEGQIKLIVLVSAPLLFASYSTPDESIKNPAPRSIA